MFLLSLTLVPQGQDIVVVVSSYGLLKKFWFLTAALLWAFQIWYWARVMAFHVVLQRPCNG